jgi:uncharacterized SAM-binding protein YcdF (DUF218 family)
MASGTLRSAGGGSAYSAAARWIRRAVLLVLALVLVYVGGVAFRIWLTARQDERPRSDAIVVLGASQFDGRPSPVLLARLKHAKALYEAGVAPHIATVGGRMPGDRFTEARAGRDYLVDAGVPKRAVIEVESGRDTLTSLQAVQRVFAKNSWEHAVIVTDPWHSYRAVRVAADLGVAAVPSPARSGPAVRTRETQLRYIARETVACIHYRIFGRSAAANVPAM